MTINPEDLAIEAFNLQKISEELADLIIDVDAECKQGGDPDVISSKIALIKEQMADANQRAQRAHLEAIFTIL